MVKEQRSRSDNTTAIATDRHKQVFCSQQLTLSVDALRCVSGPHKGEVLHLKKEIVTLGRAHWCDVSLAEDPKVSRLHCELDVSQKPFRIKDLGSNNGTFVNDTQVYDAPLEEGFRIGDSEFLLVSSAHPRQIDVQCYDLSGGLVGRSASMRKLFSLMARLAPSDASVLLQGETGVGKSSVARALHEQSPRADAPFVTVNCGSLSPSLIESSLFGYEKGAFTGALNRYKGLFEQAHGGTLFLDEIGELPLSLQPKLLDVIERKKCRRLGGKEEIDVDFRLVTATHVRLIEACKRKTFREDLYYRLAVAQLKIPPLRERLEDLPLLVEYILLQLRPDAPPTIDQEALLRLEHTPWTGNIRELRNVLERTLIFLENDNITVEQLFLPSKQETLHAPDEKDEELPEGTLKELLEEEEKRILLSALRACKWDVSKTAKRLKISRAGIYKRMTKLSINRP